MTTKTVPLTKIDDNLYHTRATLPRSAAYFSNIGEHVDTLAQLKERAEKAAAEAKAAEKAYNERFKAVFGFTVDSVTKRFDEMGVKPTEGIIFDGMDNELRFGPQRQTEVCKNPAAAYAALEEVKPGLGKKLMGYKIGDLRKHLPQVGKVWNRVVGTNYGKRAQTFKVRAS